MEEVEGTASAEELAAITGLGAAEAAVLLEAAGGDLTTAVSLHFEQEEHGGAGGRHDAPGDAGAEEYADDDGSEEGAPPAIEGVNGVGLLPPQPPGVLARARASCFWAVDLVRRLPGYGAVRSIAVGLAGILRRIGLYDVLLSLALAPLSAFGLLERPASPAGGAAAAARFIAAFEEQHGEVHPRFFRGTCHEALARARREARLVLMYLHSADHAHTPAFLSSVVGSALFSAFVDENFVFWVGDVDTQARRA